MIDSIIHYKLTKKQSVLLPQAYTNFKLYYRIKLVIKHKHHLAVYNQFSVILHFFTYQLAYFVQKLNMGKRPGFFTSCIYE